MNGKMCSLDKTVSSLLLEGHDGRCSFTLGFILCSLFGELVSHWFLPGFSNVVIQTSFRIGERAVFVPDVAIKGILSSSVCSRIAGNAYVAKDPDENKLFSILYQFRMQFVKFYYNRLAIFYDVWP